MDASHVWSLLAGVSDPEIPVISVVDLGIVRDVQVTGPSACAVTITPTYSGCPAMQVIADDIQHALHDAGIRQVDIITRLSPAWTTDWMSDAGKARLKGYGIAPPAQRVIDISGLRRGGASAPADPLRAGVARGAVPAPKVVCPHCGSAHTEVTSQFGSTPCKALYKCLDCKEPFDYFKCH
ncbi:1,2-phenylacetyl-CoA epoxidase subunit PaaD [Pseudoduganella sp. UC29_106]|uniref:1,2-phenylacetyl-CoA epoxidase subunit PaaD n=1 Tax=Pseudoduganella sp. UC29_106 TaxID=3374553 RepID=UPI003757DF26